MKYDYLIVGAGLYGATIAHEAKKAGKSVLVIDRRPNIAGNIYTEDIEHIQVHKYGAHIFHTNDKGVWDFVNEFAVFNRFTNLTIRYLLVFRILNCRMEPPISSYTCRTVSISQCLSVCVRSAPAKS